MAFPLGLAGVWEEKVLPWWAGRRQALRDAAVKAPAVSTMSNADAPTFTSSPPNLPDGVNARSA
jgi:urea transport system permease protein